MIPPPATTTSALSIAFGALRGRSVAMPGHPPHLKYQLEGGERRDVPIVEGRRHLDDVETDEGRSGGRGREQVERLPGRKAAWRRDLGAGRESRIQDVDVERDMNFLTCQTIGDLLRRNHRGAG